MGVSWPILLKREQERYSEQTLHFRVPPIMEEIEAVVHVTTAEQCVDTPMPQIMEEQIVDAPVLHVKERFVELEAPARLSTEQLEQQFAGGSFESVGGGGCWWWY